MTKKIGQWVFDLPECPKDATCAAVDRDGEGFWFTCDPSNIIIIGPFWVRREQIGVLQRIPDMTFDPTDWEHSLIVKEKKMESKMPAVKCWDVVHANNAYYMVGKHEARLLLDIDNMVGVAGCGELSISEVMRNADRIYRRSSEGFNQLELLNIIGDCAQCYMIWKRPEVREMTVDQISKELGYTVKVVGNDMGR